MPVEVLLYRSDRAARRTLPELEADLVGCREPGHAGAASAALYKLGCVYGLDRRSWLHPTIRFRLRILRAGRRAAFETQLLARIQRWKQAVAAAFVAAAVAATLGW